MIRPQVSTPCAISTAGELLAMGHLVAFPTETVYGLGADAMNPKAVARIFEVKGRPADHPLILHVASIDAAKKLCSYWPAAADQLSKAFWPGPLTLILKRADHVPAEVTGGQDTVGIRIPNHPVAMHLLQDFAQVGSGVIAAPSANRFGGVSPTRAQDVAASIGDRLGPRDLILDGGDCQVGVESTIVDCSGDTPRILRPGGISRKAIDQVLQQATQQSMHLPMQQSTQQQPSVATTPRVSGSLESHYAPRTGLRVLPAAEISQHINTMLGQKPDARMAAVLFHAADYPNTLVRVASSSADQYAHDLYATLNDLDAHGFDMMFMETPPNTQEWEAVQDRLSRASHRGKVD
jgi:L-threonylcarbamoyladenylate synthase